MKECIIYLIKSHSEKLFIFEHATLVEMEMMCVMSKAPLVWENRGEYKIVPNHIINELITSAVQYQQLERVIKSTLDWYDDSLTRIPAEIIKLLLCD